MRFSEIISEGPNDPGIFKAVFLAGGPGSGKSFIASKALDGFGFRTVNSDEMLVHLMNKAGLDLKMPPEEQEERDAVRSVAKQKTNKRMDTYLDGRLGLIIDSTGQDIDKVRKIKKRLEDMGYETKMLMVNTTENVSQERNQQRERSVNPEIVSGIWNKVQNNIPQFISLFGEENYYEIDNSELMTPEKEREITKNVWKPMKIWAGTTVSNPAAQEWFDSF